MDRSQLAIVIPALNEEATITDVVHAVSAYGVPIVIDDGSYDKTAITAQKAGANVVVHSVNRGYDGALNTGFARAVAVGCDYALTIDADGQHDPSVLSRFVAALEQGCDVVVGVRDQRQRFAEHLFASYTGIRWGLNDPLCGLKAYHLQVYQEQGYFDSYRSVGTELLLYAARKQKKIKQIAIKTRERLDEPRFGSRLRGNVFILRSLVKSFLR